MRPPRRLFLAAAAALSTAGAAPAARPSPLYWNVHESRAPPLDVAAFGFQPRNWTQVGAQCATPRCRPWSQGAFPEIDPATPVFSMHGFSDARERPHPPPSPPPLPPL